ncbi:hypothetical protein FB645_005493 [Coemansia sp. IMI 203386]|nr:hypothetical protein FB645_005493 [Coemansia sp. IMI 203386]
MSIAYEVRVNTVEADGHWYHRCLTESNHHLWRWQKQRLYRKNIFPSAPVDYSNAQGKSTFGPIKVFDGLYDPQSVEIRLFNLQYVGWVPNLRTEYYKEVVARQSLTQIQVPAVAEYLGCVVENGLIIGVALRKPKCSFEYALSQNVPCAEMHSKDLVDTIAVMQRHGMVKSPIRPSAVALDMYNRLVLVSVDCMFSSSWCGGTKLLLTPETSQKELAYSLAKTNPLGPLTEFIGGLQTVLDSPNLPRDELVRVIQSTQRDFLSSALVISTMSWPTRTHLELVKIIISLPIQEPSPDLVMAQPTISHEADPFFAAEYFEKLRSQVLAMSIQQLAESDGSWVANIGLSIEATVMQATRRIDALEKLEELTKTSEANGGQDMSRIRTYCSHVLASGTLAMHHWVAIARMVFAMFYILPFSTRTVVGPDRGDKDSGSMAMDVHVAQLVTHYGSWLRVVDQIIENHGSTLCRRMPLVIADPATQQFKWGVPSLHLVATTEILRNILVRRIMLACHRQPPGSEEIAASRVNISWVANSMSINAEEQQLENFEKKILSKIVAQDASSVYGMMSEHHLLQMAEAFTKNTAHIDAIPGTLECLELSLMHTCHGLAPILGYEEQALTQAMDMHKILDCLRDMKSTALNTCYAPLFGFYPQGASGSISYTELLLLRMATITFNVDQQWGDVANALSPEIIPGISSAQSSHLSKMLRMIAVYFDAFSLDTSEPSVDPVTKSIGFGCVTSRLMEYVFMRQASADDLSSIFMNDPRSSAAQRPSTKELLSMGIDWICEFIEFGRSFMTPQLLSTQIAAAVERAMAFFVIHDQKAELMHLLSQIELAQWKTLASAGFSTDKMHNGIYDSALSVVWSCARRMTATEFPRTAAAAPLLDSTSWQVAISLSYPSSAFLGYLLLIQCIDVASQIVHTNDAGEMVSRLNKDGIEGLQVVEKMLSTDGSSAWSALSNPAFTPQLYAGGKAGKELETFARSQLSEAISVLFNSSYASFIQKLGISASSSRFTEADMRMVAIYITSYLENAPDLLPRLVAMADTSSPSSSSGPKQKQPNPFKAANILNRLPPIESQYNSNACDISATVGLWRRNITQLPYASSRTHIQSLIAECYPSNNKHYLEQVIVRFMEAEPLVGVDLVIGSIADHMWKNQIVYSRRSSPFYAIRAMFSLTRVPKDHHPSSNATGALPATDSDSNSTARELASSKTGPVFNAVVGGKVRPQAGSQSISAAASHQHIPTTAEQTRAASASIGHRPAGTSGPATAFDFKEDDSVSSPVACLRILLLLIALRYGNSMTETPIYIWLTDCADHAPISVMRLFFETLLAQEPPKFSSDLPLESDWNRKVFAYISMWANDPQLRPRRVSLAMASAVLCNVLRDGGERWADRWSKWSKLIKPSVFQLFSSVKQTAIQRDVVNAMLKVPLTLGNDDGTSVNLSATRSHPIYLLTDILNAESERNKLTFANVHDWFLSYIMPQILCVFAENENAQSILGQLLMSVDNLYSVVPWLDIATSLVQNVPLSRGCPVSMNPAMAKRHFISYVSPLARILFAISSYVEGAADSAEGELSADIGTGENNNEEQLSAKSGTDLPVSATDLFSEPDHGYEDEMNVQGEFNWQWLEECLIVYVSGSSNSNGNVTNLEDTIDALLDVYTYSSVHGLRQAIENVVVASSLNNSRIADIILSRMFAKRPLDIFTLHSLKPRCPSSMPVFAHSATDGESPFRPGAELFPLTRRLLHLMLGDGQDITRILQVCNLIENCMWIICEEPDIRRNLIALKPRLIPKEQRPAANDTSTSHDTVLQTTSGSLHIPSEAVASAAAYALDRSVYLLGLLVTRSGDTAGTRSLFVALANSRVFLATLMTAVGDSMRQFATLSTTRELLNALWNIADQGNAKIGDDGLSTEQVWTGVNFFTLAQRLNSQLPEEFMTWTQIQSLPIRY